MTRSLAYSSTPPCPCLRVGTQMRSKNVHVVGEQNWSFFLTYSWWMTKPAYFLFLKKPPFLQLAPAYKHFAHFILKLLCSFFIKGLRPQTRVANLFFHIHDDPPLLCNLRIVVLLLHFSNKFLIPSSLYYLSHWPHASLAFAKRFVVEFRFCDPKVVLIGHCLMWILEALLQAYGRGREFIILSVLISSGLKLGEECYIRWIVSYFKRLHPSPNLNPDENTTNSMSHRLVTANILCFEISLDANVDKVHLFG